MKLFQSLFILKVHQNLFFFWARFTEFYWGVYSTSKLDLL